MVMKKADDNRPLKGFIQIDDVYWGGKSSGGKRSRGAEGKAPFVAALERNEKGHPMFIRFSRVASFNSAKMLRWAKNILTQNRLCFRTF
jgi:hypothetical protein